MPLAGDSYDIDDAWRDRVLVRMTEIGIKNPAQLAAKMGCNRNVVHDLLKRGETAIRRSAYVSRVHAALEWAPPRSWLLSDEEIEMLDVFRVLAADQRAIVRRDAAARIVTTSNPDRAARREAVRRTLYAAVATGTSQIEAVPSGDEAAGEGNDEGGRAGRAARGR